MGKVIQPGQWQYMGVGWGVVVVWDRKWSSLNAVIATEPQLDGMLRNGNVQLFPKTCRSLDMIKYNMNNLQST